MFFEVTGSLIFVGLFSCATGWIVNQGYDVIQTTGSTAQLSCTAHVGYDILEWREYITNTRYGRRIYDTRSDVIRMPGYDVREKHQTFYLIIKNLDTNTAGMYACRLLRSQERITYSIVALDSPICGLTFSSARRNTKKINLSSTTRYYGSLDRVTFKSQWHTTKGVSTPGSMAANDTHIEGKLTVEEYKDVSYTNRICLSNSRTSQTHGRQHPQSNYCQTCVVDMLRHPGNGINHADDEVFYL